MTETRGPVLSVRGQAIRTVAPDYATVFGALDAIADSKQDALAAVGLVLDEITAELADLGGVVSGVETQRAPLTWSARSAGTHREIVHDFQKQRPEETGRVTANVALHLVVRDFSLLDPLGDRLARHERLNVHAVNWSVDDDNPGWPLVRAEAIQAALRQGRDYAEALGSSLVSVDHVADAGLLGGGAEQSRIVRQASARAMSGGPDGGPSLDPVPHELTATIEARFSTTPVTLPAG